MLVNLFVNIGIMLATIYFYFSFNSSTTHYQEKNWRHYVIYTLCVSGVGILQMMFSIVLGDIRFDFRGLLLALAFKYLDLKITLSSIAILTVARFFWGANETSMINVGIAIYLVLTMPLLLRLMKDKLSNSKQLILLVANTTLTTSITIYYLIHNWQQLVQVMTLLWSVNYLLLFFSLLIIKDLTRMVTIINNDCLTNLNNQRRFQEDLEILDTVEDDVSIALIDIDLFKQYNDTYGHETGDLVLQKFSEILLSHIGSQTNAYRAGGEEFVLIMRGKTPQEAEQAVIRFHQMIQKTSFLEINDGTVLHPTISVGLAHRELPETARETYRRADQAVYYCKNNGRDQVKVAKSPLRLLTQHAETKVIYDADTLGQTFGTQLAPQKAEVAERNEGQ